MRNSGLIIVNPKVTPLLRSDNCGLYGWQFHNFSLINSWVDYALVISYHSHATSFLNLYESFLLNYNMAATEITTFNINPILEANGQQTVDDVIQEAVNALQETSPPHQFVLGTQVQDNGIVQIVSKWNGSAAQGSDSPLKSLVSIFGPVQDNYHVVFHEEAVEDNHPATANVVEFVKTRFPASRVSPEFQQDIEKDFRRFDDIYVEEVKGHLGCAYGWVVETQKIEGEDVKSFLVMRGWESMDSFEQSIQTGAFKKSIPILLGWNAPYQMVRLHISSYKSLTGS
jgi:hypothetical protein